MGAGGAARTVALLVGLVAVVVGASAVVSDEAELPEDDEFFDSSAATAAAPRPRPPAAKGAGAAGVARSGRGAVPADVAFELEHCLSGGKVPQFVAAGTFHARAAQAAGRSAAGGGEGALRLTHVKLQRKPLDGDEKAAFGRLVRDDLPYRVRVPASVVNGGEFAGRYAMAWLPARCLAEAQLQENFVMHMDDGGNVVGIEYTTPSAQCQLFSDYSFEPSTWKFGSTVSVKFPKEAPRLNPDAPNPEFARKGDGPGGTGKGKEKTFLQKNWMWMFGVGFLAMQLLTAPDQQQGGGGRGGGAAR